MRFSPVDTGNTEILNHGLDPTPVQPRGYGEHSVIINNMTNNIGSAPWIRGTLVTRVCSSVNFRFSPVDTGNTENQVFLSPELTVQPRGYGEHCI